MSPAQSINLESRHQIQLRRKLEQIQSDLGQVLGAANRLEQEIAQILAKGGTFTSHTKLHFLTGAFARMQSDMGVVDYLQNEKVVVRPPLSTKR